MKQKLENEKLNNDIHEYFGEILEKEERIKNLKKKLI